MYVNEQAVKEILEKVKPAKLVAATKYVDELEKQAKKHDLKVHILLQVNIAREESKHGFDIEEMDEVMNYLMKCPSLIVDGLMMMAPNIEVEKTRVYFRQTKELLEQLKKEYPDYPLKELSMGMSQDYKVALEEGATLVRIGRALFKDE